MGVGGSDSGPSGTAPPGKIWSEEHQHYHDAPGFPSDPLSQPMTPNPTAQTSTPQPDGPVPPGKVWSPEHGHWHDLPAASAADTTQGG